MKKLQSTIRICGLALFASMLLANATSAWGPEDRPTYTNKSPAPYATFNSITDNAAVGDERYFVRVGEVGSNEPYKDSIKVVPGKEYEVYIYYHNDAASNTNASGLGMATNVKVASTYPAVISKGARGTVTGNITWNYVDSPNTSPKHGEVWDEAFLDTDYENVIMRYKPGTAILHNAGATNGSQLTSDIFNPEGVMIGHVGLNGIIPGCAEYSGYVTYTLTADVDASTVSKKVSLDGENWAEKVNAKPGQYVTYRVEFNNTGTTKLTNVIFKDSHDDGLFLVAGSTTFFDVDHTDGLKIDDILDISGYNTGDSYPGGRKWINYQLKIAEDESLCSKTLKNTISVRYNAEDQQSDEASVYVYCEDTPPPPDCETDPTMDGCETPPPDCETDPTMEGCDPPKEKNCETDPTMEGCELPNTGPLEIIMAILVVAGICGGGYYFYRSRKNLNKVEKKAKGKKSPKEQSETKLKPEGENIAETTEPKPTDEIKK